MESCRAYLFDAGAGEHGEGGVTARIHDRARLDGGARAAGIHFDGVDTADTVALGELGVEARFERLAFAGERIGDGGECGSTSSRPQRIGPGAAPARMRRAASSPGSPRCASTAPCSLRIRYSPQIEWTSAATAIPPSAP